MQNVYFGKKKTKSFFLILASVLIRSNKATPAKRDSIIHLSTQAQHFIKKPFAKTLPLDRIGERR